MRRSWAALAAAMGVVAVMGADVAAAAPGCAHPTAGRVALWPGEDTTQDVAGGHDGVLHGDGAAYENGKAGRAFSLPGNEDHMTVDDAYDTPGDLTLDAWVKLADTDFSRGGSRAIFFKADANDAELSYALWIEGSDVTAEAAPITFAAGSRSLGGSHAYSDALEWREETWYHVAATRTGNDVAFYRDGDPVGTATLGQAPLTTPGTPLAIGGAPVGGTVYNAFKGAIDEPEIFSRALDPSEVASVAGLCAAPPPLRTTITAGPADGGEVADNPSFSFVSSVPGSTFRCLLTSPPGTIVRTRSFDCASPAVAELGAPGAYTFSVFATDPDGNADPVGDHRTFTKRAPVPVNLTRPTMISQSTAAGGGYRCDPGTWKDAERFEYAWLQRRLLVHGGASIPVEYIVVGWSQVYHPDKSDEGHEFVCRVTGYNGPRHAEATSEPRLLGDDFFGTKLKTYGNFRLRGIDLFQVVQPSAGAAMFRPGPGLLGDLSPIGFTAPASSGQDATYSGVTMDAGKPATAVVYLDRTGPGTNDPLEVSLTAKLGGVTLGTETRTMGKPPSSASPVVTAAERDDPRFGVQFPLPYAWLDAAAALPTRQLDFEATVRFAPGVPGLGVRECFAGTDCSGDNRFGLHAVPARRVTSLHVVSLELLGRGQAPGSFASPLQVLSRATQLFPGGERLAAFPAASIDVTAETEARCGPIILISRSCRSARVQAAMERWFADNEKTANAAGHYDVMLGLHDYRTGDVGNDVLEPGWTAGANTLANGAGVPLFTANQGSAGRPLTAAAHEFGHVIGAPHADLTCGGNTAPEKGQLWPPDNQGRLQGVKWDWKASAGGKVDPVTDTAATPLFDLMSYCASEPNAWLSAYNYNRAFDVLSGYRSKATRHLASARAPMAFASGIAGPGGGRIERVVEPDEADDVPASVADSPLRLRSLDAGGRTLADVGVAVHGVSEGGDGGTFLGAVAPDATTVQLVRDGTVLDTRRRTATPRVDVVAPRLVRDGWLVRWSATDRDSDTLHATVDYSADGGRSWRTVYDGLSRGRTVIPSTVLQGSARARIRVNVSDGFGEARASSPRFTVAGAAPSVRILRPAGGESVRAGERLLLTGAAFDDAHRELGGRSLTWYAGRRLLGHGRRLRAVLPAGRVVLRLVASVGRATAPTGRAVRRSGSSATPRAATSSWRASLRPSASAERLRAEARRTLKVAPAPLVLRRIDCAQRVRRGTRSVSVRIAVSAPATLVAAGRSYRVGPAARRIAITLPAGPAVGLLEVPFKAGTVRGTIAVIRA